MSYDLAYGRRSGDGERKLRNVSASWTSPSFSCININERGTHLRKEENNEWWRTEADTNGVCGPWNSSSLLVWLLDSLQLTPCTQGHANTHANSSSLSPSGGLPNPYCLFFETSLLISPRDRSWHTGPTIGWETRRGANTWMHRLWLTSGVPAKVLYLDKNIEKKITERLLVSNR